MRDGSRHLYARRRLGLLAVAVVLAVGAYAGADRSGTLRARAAGIAAKGASAKAASPAPPSLVVNAPGRPTASWKVVASAVGRPAAWIAERAGVALLRFDQSLVHLTLHAGSSDGGTTGWTYGDEITRTEIHHIVAAFNGGFKLTYGEVGFVSGGHVAVALKPGLASIVTYTDGTTDVGAWSAGGRTGVPAVGKRVFSVLQNQRLLVDRGTAAPNLSTCILSCWGATIGAQTVVARSGLGITAGGQLVWAAGERLTPAGLAAALISVGAVRAIELDINPDWVAGYLYIHRPGGPVPVPVVPGQIGIAGKFLTPYARDFLAVVANR
jgi:hypothetical protein